MTLTAAAEAAAAPWQERAARVFWTGIVFLLIGLLIVVGICTRAERGE